MFFPSLPLQVLASLFSPQVVIADLVEPVDLQNFPQPAVDQRPYLINSAS